MEYVEKCVINKLRDLSILDVAKRLELTHSNGRCLCVHHAEKHPSMQLNAKTNTYRCWSCGAHGDNITLTMQVLGLGFREACEWLVSEKGVISDSHRPATEQCEAAPRVDLHHLSQLMEHPRLSAEAQRFLFDERHIDPLVVEWMGLSSITTDVPMSGSLRGGWFHGPALLMPYRSMDGALLSVQARYLGTDQKARFQFPKGASTSVYGLPVLKTLRHGEDLYIGEGISDVLSLLTSGVKAIGCASATTMISTHDLSLLRQFAGASVWHLFPDQDSAGARYYETMLRVANDLGVCLVRHELPEGCKDFGEYWRSTSVARH